MLNLRNCLFANFQLISSIVLLLSVCSSGFAQTDLPSKPITLHLTGQTLEEALELISTQSGITFSYNPNRIPIKRKIVYSAESKPLKEVLDYLSSSFTLSYEFLEGQVILKPASAEITKATQLATLSGFITDASNGEALIGATVSIHELNAGVTSNVFGFYSITIPTGTYTIDYSFVGFEKTSQSISLNQSISVNVPINPSPSVLKEIVVIGSDSRLVNDIQVSRSNLKPSTISEKPALFGEADAVKSLEAMPGVKMHSDGSTFYYVRGGDRDQNLILLDDAPIFNPSHLLGIFSTLIPEAINDISFYKGNMPASLGGRLSSVMDVRTKKGNDQHFQTSGSVGLLSTKLSVEGPFKKDKSSFLLSGRVSRVKWFFKLNNDNIQKFQFYDLTGKTNFTLNQKNKLFFSFYTGSDNFFITNSGIEWTNRTTSLRWNHVFNRRLFLNTTLAGGVYDYFLHTNIQNQAKWNSHVSNVNLKADFSYFKNPREEITFGLTLGGYNFNPGNFSTNGISPFPIVSVKNSSELVLYGNHEVHINDHWGLNYGIRLSSWSSEGPSFEVLFDENRNPFDTLYYKKGEQYKTYANAAPRVSLSYFFNENSSLKASVAHNVQNLHLISNSISPFTSFEVWLPSSTNIRPQTANQVVLGYYTYLKKPGLTFELESFYKKMKNQIDYEEHAETLLNPLVERELRFGTANAYGAELQLKKEQGRVRGWIGYSYSRAKRNFNEVNQGRTFNAFYDRPHQINLVVSYDLNLKWNIGLNWNYTTGAPFSTPVSFYMNNGLEVPLYDQKNNSRLPDYHRLDLSATVQLNKNPEHKFKHNLSFSIYNVYGRKNPLFINYNKVEQNDGSFKVPGDLLGKNIVSTEFYLFQFIPAISYNFKWR